MFTFVTNDILRVDRLALSLRRITDTLEAIKVAVSSAPPTAAKSTISRLENSNITMEGVHKPRKSSNSPTQRVVATAAAFPEPAEIGPLRPAPQYPFSGRTGALGRKNMIIKKAYEDLPKLLEANAAMRQLSRGAFQSDDQSFEQASKAPAALPNRDWDGVSHGDDWRGRADDALIESQANSVFGQQSQFWMPQNTGASASVHLNRPQTGRHSRTAATVAAVKETIKAVDAASSSQRGKPVDSLLGPRLVRVSRPTEALAHPDHMSSSTGYKNVTSQQAGKIKGLASPQDKPYNSRSTET